MSDFILEDWLVEQDMAPTTSPDASGMQAPQTDPNIASANVANPPQEMYPEPTDVSKDVQFPDMPEEQDIPQDFETWKNQYFRESVKGDPNILLDLLSPMRDKDSLSSYQRKFVEDNLNIQLIRQNANVDKVAKEFRRSVRDRLDRNNPGTSVVNHLVASLETIPMLSNIFIKLNGYSGAKGDLHRKFIGALCSSVQVGSGAGTEDIIFNDKSYSIPMSTRFNSRWGDVQIGAWSLKEDDPDRYLSEPEKKRLDEGSPEEKDVLRRRVVMESISNQYQTRAFIIHVVDDDGTIYVLGWDIASCLRSAYSEGKLVVKTRYSENSEAMIDDQGAIVPLVDLKINYVKETGRQDEEGKPDKEELEFMERREGMLFLTADVRTIKEASSALQGMSFKQVPYTGNPSDLKVLRRCIYSAHDLLMRQC